MCLKIMTKCIVRLISLDKVRNKSKRARKIRKHNPKLKIKAEKAKIINNLRFKLKRLRKKRSSLRVKFNKANPARKSRLRSKKSLINSHNKSKSKL